MVCMKSTTTQGGSVSSMSTDTTIQQKAAEAGSWFERAKRDHSTDSDEYYVRTKDGTPEWVTQLVYDAHGQFLPDDWRYEVIRDALSAIEEADDPDDISGEFADSAVDVYNANRTAWLASNLNRAAYCDEAAEEFGYDPANGVFGLIALGQYREASEVFYSVLGSLQAQIED